METLNVFLRGQLAGELSFGDEGLSFSYKEEYLKDAEARKLSSSLPLEQKYFKHQECQAFFSGLLPDGKIREALAQYLQISETNIFGLLKAIGGECAGAISLHSPNKNKIEQRYSYKILESKAAQRLLSALDQRPFLVGEEGLRMSAGGAQSKLMVSFNKGQLALPLYDTPSTHILKPAMKGFEDSVFNEFFCMQLAQHLGLKVPSTEVIWIENSSYYLIERYDRRTNDSGETERLHQEDFCQALNIPPELKYENEGGPSLVRSMCLVDSRVKQGLMRGVTKIEFLRIIIFNYLIGNGDAHGKNFSLLYEAREESLAPFYDLLSTMVYSNPYKSKMAMKLGGAYKFHSVGIKNFEKLADACNIKFSLVDKQINYFKKNILKQAEKLSEELSLNSQTQSKIYQKIIEVIIINIQALAC